LSLDTFQGNISPLSVSKFKSSSVVVSKIKFTQVSLQVLLADMVIRPFQPTLEDSEVTLNGVCVDVTTDILTDSVPDNIVPSELATNQGVLTSLVGHQAAVCCHLRLDIRLKCSSGYAGNVVRTNSATPLDQRQYLALMLVAATFLALSLRFALIAKSFINFNDLAATAQHSAAVFAHGFADAVGHEPGRFIGDT